MNVSENIEALSKSVGEWGVARMRYLLDHHDFHAEAAEVCQSAVDAHRADLYRLMVRNSPPNYFPESPRK